jgi:hypothetical protein
MLDETLCAIIEASKWHESSAVMDGLYSKGTDSKPAPHRAVNRENTFDGFKSYRERG